MRRYFPLIAAGVVAAVAACAPPPADSASPADMPPVAVESPTQPSTVDPSVTASPTTEPSTSEAPSTKPQPTATATATPTPSTQPAPTLTPGPALYAKGASGDEVRELQARLRQIGWFDRVPTGFYGPSTATSVSGFQGRRQLPVTGEVDQRTWDRLVSMTRQPTKDELTPPAAKPKTNQPRSTAGLDPRCLTGRALCISKKTNSMSWVIDGKVQMTVDVRFGSAELPTREGAFSILWKSRDHVSNIYHTKMPFAMFFSGGQAVHYSPDFAANGYSGASHGCVNVRNRGAIESLFNQTRVGDKVIVYR